MQCSNDQWFKDPSREYPSSQKRGGGGRGWNWIQRSKQSGHHGTTKEIKQQRFWAWTSTRSRLFASQGSSLVETFVKIVSNLLASRHIKRQKAWPPVDVRHSKAPLLELPNVVDLSHIPVNKGTNSRLTWTKHSDLFEIVHPSLILISLCLLTGA